MNRPFFLGWFKTMPGITAGFATLFCGILVGIHAWLSFGNPLAETYQLDFSGAKWIRPADESDTGYFRKRFYLTSNATHAYLQLAGTDYYEAYVNGSLLRVPALRGDGIGAATASEVSTEPATQFDITPFLVKGQNTLTVYVHRRIRTRGPDVLVKGCITDGAGQKQWIYSDGTWRAKAQPDDLVGDMTWAQPSLDDTTWPLARVTSRSVPGWFVQPVTVPPVVVQSQVEGHWISPLDMNASQVFYRRDFSVPWGTDSTWLVVGATGSYTVYLNGNLVASSGQVLFSQVPLALGSIDLGPWLKWGSNRLEIRTENAMAENALLSNVCFVKGDGSMSVLATDRTWLVRAIGTRIPQSQWNGARELAAYGDSPYGYRMKSGYAPLLSPSEQARRQAWGLVLGLFVLALWCIAWARFSKHLAEKRDISLEKALTIDAIAQVPIGVAVLFLILLSLDVRFSPDLPYGPYVFVGLLVLSGLLRWRLWISSTPDLEPEADRFPATRRFIHDYGFGVGLLLIVVAAFILRASSLMNFPLDHDEVFMRNVTHGIVERGYPSMAVNNTVYRLTTYELVPWPEAVCAILTGWQDWSLRIPPLLFGTCVCGMIGVIGSRMFSRRTGILAALVYGFMAFDVQWARHCFHLQQTQFFAVLSFYAYYESIYRGGGVDRRYFPMACILTCLTYLSWEGSGFILPAFAVMMVAMNPTDWRWLKQLHFWVWFIFVCAVVLVQLSSRAMVFPLYLSMGYGLNDIVGPSLNFLDQRNNTLYYYYRLMMMDSHAILGILAIIGLPLMWKQKPFRYVLLLFFLLLACESGLLPIFSIRYCYYYQPLLVLGGCAVLMEFYDRLAELTRTVAEVDWAWAGRWARASVMAFIVVTFLVASEAGVYVFRIANPQSDPVFFSRYDDSYFDYDNSSQYVRQRIRPGDTVIAMMPDTFAHFSGGITASECNPDLAKRVLFASTFNPPEYIDGHSITQALRDMVQLQDMYYRHNRVWFIAEPSSLFNAMDVDASSFVKNISRDVYENESGVVYLWDGGGDPTVPVPAPAITPGPFGATPTPQQTPDIMLPPTPSFPLTVTTSPVTTSGGSSYSRSGTSQSGSNTMPGASAGQSGSTTMGGL